jgi:hypothetical protein
MGRYVVGGDGGMDAYLWCRSCRLEGSWLRIVCGDHDDTLSYFVNQAAEHEQKFHQGEQ